MSLSTNSPSPTTLDEERVMVALSGGVDSAVSAYQLQRAGFAVDAIFMKNWEEDDTSEYCSAAEDLADAERVCERLGLSLRTVNFATEYWERVFERFLAEYRIGRTPNPDVWCNREIKFRELYDFLTDIGQEQIATGHYARVSQSQTGYQLLKGLDADKDQTYFLYTIGQAELARVRFPIGEMTKQEVRAVAHAAGLANHDKKGSTGICFIGERPFRAFLSQYIQPAPGPMRTPEGQHVGEHQGLAFYTLGQRQGLGLGGARGGDGQPWYVVDKHIGEETLIVAQGREHPLLYSAGLSATEASWVAGDPPSEKFSASAKTRYRQDDTPCIVTVTEEGFDVGFEHPQWAVTPGQSVVLYQGDVCIGGGVIDARHRALSRTSNV